MFVVFRVFGVKLGVSGREGLEYVEFAHASLFDVFSYDKPIDMRTIVWMSGIAKHPQLERYFYSHEEYYVHAYAIAYVPFTASNISLNEWSIDALRVEPVVGYKEYTSDITRQLYITVCGTQCGRATFGKSASGWLYIHIYLDKPCITKRIPITACPESPPTPPTFLL